MDDSFIGGQVGCHSNMNASLFSGTVVLGLVANFCKLAIHMTFGPMELLATEHTSHNVDICLAFIGPNGHDVICLNPTILHPTLN